MNGFLNEWGEHWRTEIRAPVANDITIIGKGYEIRLDVTQVPKTDSRYLGRKVCLTFFREDENFNRESAQTLANVFSRPKRYLYWSSAMPVKAATLCTFQDPSDNDKWMQFKVLSCVPALDIYRVKAKIISE